MGFFDDDDKTERATTRRRQETREKGQVAQSKELMAALMLFAALAGLLLFGGGIANAVGGLTVLSMRRIGDLGPAQLDVETSAAILSGAAQSAGLAVAPILALMIVAGLVVGLGQVGLAVTPKALEPKPSNLNPITGAGRILGARGIARPLLALLKILVILAVMSFMAWTQADEAAALGGAELGPMLAGTGHVMLRCVLGGLVAILVLAVIDYAYQRWQHERDMRMSKQEVKDENRNAEGDPRVKARIRRVQRELATQRMMEAVPKATVVVTNPTHYAVALKYERPAPGDESPPAPRVVAKGVDHVARRIRELATESDVPLFEDPPLARALYAQVEIGGEIPVELYEAVAGVLAYVYRIQGMAATA